MSPSDSPLPRKEFLRLLGMLGSAAAVTAFLQACQRAGLDPTAIPTATLRTPAATAASTATPEPIDMTEATQTEAPSATQTPTSWIGRVALVRTADRAAGVRQAIDLLGENLVRGKDVFLKPNYNSADPTPGSTHIDVLRALVLKLREMGAVNITLGDRSGMGDTRKVFQARGVFDLAQELDFATVVFDELAAEDWVRCDSPGSHWKQGFYLPRAVLESPAVVQTCCLKTHRYGGHFTLSLKNSVGLAARRLTAKSHNFMDELHTSSSQRRMIAEINAAYSPALVVLDGVEAFTNGGPDQGRTVKPEVVLAGRDRIALDAVGVAILRLYGTTSEVSYGPVFKQEQIARAVELKLGVDSPEKIELLVEDEAGEDFAAQVRAELLKG